MIRALLYLALVLVVVMTALSSLALFASQPWWALLGGVVLWLIIGRRLRRGGAPVDVDPAAPRFSPVRSRRGGF